MTLGHERRVMSDKNSRDYVIERFSGEFSEIFCMQSSAIGEPRFWFVPFGASSSCSFRIKSPRSGRRKSLEDLRPESSSCVLCRFNSLWRTAAKINFYFLRIKRWAQFAPIQLSWSAIKLNESEQFFASQLHNNGSRFPQRLINCLPCAKELITLRKQQKRDDCQCFACQF